MPAEELGWANDPPPDVLHSSCTVRAGASSWIAAVFPPRARPLGDSWETKCCGNCSHSYIELCRYVLCEWEGRQSQRPWEVKWQARVERKIEEECHTCVCVLASPQWTLCVSPLHTLHFIIHNIRWSLQSRGSTWFTTKVYTVKTGAPKLFSPTRAKTETYCWAAGEKQIYGGTFTPVKEVINENWKFNPDEKKRFP